MRALTKLKIAIAVWLFMNGQYVVAAYGQQVAIVPDQYSEFSARVDVVGPYGDMHFEGGQRARLWGVLPTTDYVEDLLMGRVINCDFVGETSVLRNQRRRQVSIVDCLLDRFDPQRTVISRHLVETGNGIEICTETRGLFGTCPHY